MDNAKIWEQLTQLEPIEQLGKQYFHQKVIGVDCAFHHYHANVMPSAYFRITLINPH